MSAFWKKFTWVHALCAFVLSVALFVAYMHIYTMVFHFELPFTRYLRHRNEALMLEAKMLNIRMSAHSDALEALQVRDEDIYRSIFGLNSIPLSVRDEGVQSSNRYEELEYGDRGGNVRAICHLADRLKKKAYIQSKSYDEIELMLHSADEMATSIPAIWPVVPDMNKIHLSSRFGWRLHPVLGYTRGHDGIDLSMKPGNAIYATGDGVVEKVEYERRGYGHHVVINHGFGYKSIYAHCKSIFVAEGIKVKRGEQIAESGNSGLCSGPHLHYEIRYKDRPVNPLNYFDMDMPVNQYKDMINKAQEGSEKFYIHPSHQK